MPILYYILFWLFVTFCHVVICPRLSIWEANPDIILAIVILLALKRTRKTALWFGFAFGLTIDLIGPHTLGWTTLLLSLTGYLSAVFREKIFIESYVYQLVFIVSFSLIYQLFSKLIITPQYFIYNVKESIIISFFTSIFTTIVAAIILFLITQRYRLRELLYDR